MKQSTSEEGHPALYYRARLYAEAFQWSDVEQECRFMLDLCQAHGVEVGHVLEVAAGPASHARWFASQGVARSFALDLSPAMVAYGKCLAQEEGCELTYFQGDMRRFDLPDDGHACVDLAFCLLDSISYLTTQEDFLSHLDALSRAMKPGGLYVLVASHPRDVLTGEASTESQWEVEVEDRTIRVQFGLPGDVLDPITQVKGTTVRIEEWRGDALLYSIEEQSPMKVYLYPELCALIAASSFTLIASCGAMREGVALDMSPEAWRMVLVLQLK